MWIPQCDCWKTISCEPDLADSASGACHGSDPCAEPDFVRVRFTVDPAHPAVVQLCADLIATMRVSPGCVGLAAPQVGVAAQAFCVDVSAHPKARTSHGLIVLLNAEIVEASR